LRILASTTRLMMTSGGLMPSGFRVAFARQSPSPLGVVGTECFLAFPTRLSGLYHGPLVVDPDML
jgi:hypothetical protein